MKVSLATMREIPESYRQIWTALPVPALTLNGDDAIVDLNPAAEAFFNQSARSVVSKPLCDWVELDAPIFELFEKIRVGQGPAFINELKVLTGNTEHVLCNIRVAALGQAQGELLVLIEPQSQAQRTSISNAGDRAARSAIGMAEMLSHEIKNPLAGITGAAQLLSMGLDQDDQQLTDLIVSESRRIVTLLDKVERFGNALEPAPVSVNIHDLLDRARKSALVSFAKHMRFVEDYDPSLPATFADPDQLLQVILNLLRNAAEASPDGGTITLRTYYDLEHKFRRAGGSGVNLPLQIEVVDDGPGLPAHLGQDIFQPFVSGKQNGSGLGLALARKIIADHDAWITAASEPGKTVFRISMPVTKISGEPR